MVTSADLQQMIVDEVGDLLPPLSPFLAPRIALIWESFADKALIHPRLQELYSKRRCIDLMLGQRSNQVGFSMNGDLSLHLEQRTQYLMNRREETQKEILRLEAQSRANRPGAVGPLVATELETPPFPPPPPTFPLDANNPATRGSPYFYNPGDPTIP